MRYCTTEEIHITTTINITVDNSQKHHVKGKKGFQKVLYYSSNT